MGLLSSDVTTIVEGHGFSLFASQYEIGIEPAARREFVPPGFPPPEDKKK
jgi:hypothetical protein